MANHADHHDFVAGAVVEKAGDVAVTYIWIQFMVDYIVPWLWSVYHIMAKGAR